jgi:hypothetical protein
MPKQIRILQLSVVPWNEIDPVENWCNRPGDGHFPNMPADYLHAANRHTWTTGIDTPPDYLLYTTIASQGGSVLAAAHVTGWRAGPTPGRTTWCFDGPVLTPAHPIHQLFVGQDAPREPKRNPCRPFWVELNLGKEPRIWGDND